VEWFRDWISAEREHFTLQHRIFLCLQLIVVIICVYFAFHLPLPGWSIAVLAGVAAAMSVHGEMRSWQKVFWMVLIGALLMIELKAIRHDRDEANAQALSDREAQDQKFKGIRDKQDQDFATTAGELKDAIGGIESTLKTTDQTFKQTEPHALIRLEPITLLNPPTAPATFQAGVGYRYNSDFTNHGNEAAGILGLIMRFYIGSPDSEDEQRLIAASFAKESSNPPKKIGSTVPPFATGYWSDTRTFTPDEVAQLGKGKTIYILRRIVYRDSTGTWLSDDCKHYQMTPDGHGSYQLWINVLHPCKVFMNERHKLGSR
jgi:hypothetical protein